MSKGCRCFIALGLINLAIGLPKPVSAQPSAKGQPSAAVGPKDREVASTDSLDSADQRLMDAERALLQSLSARAMMNNGIAPGEAPKAAPVEKVSAKIESVKKEEKPIAAKVAQAVVQPAKAAEPALKSVEKASSEPTLMESFDEDGEKKVALKPPSGLPLRDLTEVWDGKHIEEVKDFSEVAVTQPAKVAPPAKAVAVSAPIRDVAPNNSDAIRNSNANLKRDLQSAQGRIESLERELDQTRSQLTLAETEVTRLSSRLDTKNRASLGKYNLPNTNTFVDRPQDRAPARRPEQAVSRETVSNVRPPAANADLQVATVAVDKADLRLGPGKNHSALMAVPRGSRLVVETRQGEWYRVFAPSGERAWINSSMVVFGDGGSTLNDGTASRVKGFNASDEEEAFRRVQRITAGQ